MATDTTPATLADLQFVDGRAELVNGTIIVYPVVDDATIQTVAPIYQSLQAFLKDNGPGFLGMDQTRFVVPVLSSGRQTFSPEVAYFGGERSRIAGNVITGPPTLAVEIRAEDAITQADEAARAAKRADYFEAGTLVVWDVDPASRVIAVYRYSDPTTPCLYPNSSLAEAEPALPGWTIDTRRVFPI
jgi:Uma2 family endonuclease